MDDQKIPEVEQQIDLSNAPHGESVTLDLRHGYQDYIAATLGTLNRIQASGYPGDPRKTANLILLEMGGYADSLLPGIDIRECAALYGAALGIALGGYIHSGDMPLVAADQIMAEVYSAMRHTIPLAQQVAAAIADQEQHGLVDAAGQPVSSQSPMGVQIPRIAKKRSKARKVARKMRRKK